MASLFTEIDLLKTELKIKNKRIEELELKLEKYNYYKNKAGHLQAKLNKIKRKAL